MSRPGPSPRALAAGTLFLARIVYAFSWYNIGAVLPLVRTSLAVDPAELGIVLGSFLLGAGIFQVPAGFAALRWGSRSVSIGGIFTMGAFGLASAFSPDWIVLSALRFGTGAGAALFFSPALGLVTAYFPRGSRGPAIGAYNAAFSVGSGAGLFLGALIGLLWGWPAALAVGGILLLAVAGLLEALLPRPAPAVPRVASGNLWRIGLPILRSRALWSLALATSGLWAAFFVAAQYFVEFASQVHPGWGLAVAAAVPTVMIAAEVAGGPIGGWLGERTRDMRRTLLFWSVLSGIGIALIPLLSLPLAWPTFAFLGFADGVIFAILYLLPTYLPLFRGESYALGLALLNSIQIFVGSGLSIAFALIAAAEGFAWAWVAAGVLAVGLLPLLLGVPPVNESAGAGRKGTAPLPRPRPRP